MSKLRLVSSLVASVFIFFQINAQSVTGELSLVDRLGATVLSYETGDSIYVLVADADRNVSTSASDTLTVRLRSDKETTEEALVLYCCTMQNLNLHREDQSKEEAPIFPELQTKQCGTASGRKDVNGRAGYTLLNRTLPNQNLLYRNLLNRT